MIVHQSALWSSCCLHRPAGKTTQLTSYLPVMLTFSRKSRIQETPCSLGAFWISGRGTLKENRAEWCFLNLSPREGALFEFNLSPGEGHAIDFNLFFLEGYLRINVHKNIYLHKNVRLPLQSLSGENSLIKIRNSTQLSMKRNNKDILLIIHWTLFHQWKSCNIWWREGQSDGQEKNIVQPEGGSQLFHCRASKILHWPSCSE